MPTNLDKFQEIYAFKKIEPNIKDLETYNRFQKKAFDVNLINTNIREEQRYPDESEVKRIGAYCTGLL
jgi:hypothetical protein